MIPLILRCSVPLVGNMISSLTRITRFGFPNSFVSCEKVCESLLIDTICPGSLRDNTLFERSVDVAATIDRNWGG